MSAYIVRVVHSDENGVRYTAFDGPFETFSAAGRYGDALLDRYDAEPMRVDGDKCSTECYVETLSAPARIV